MVFCVDIYGSHQLLVSSHLGEQDKMLLRAILSGGVWNGFLLSKVKEEDINCRCCNALDNDGNLFWDCTFPLFVELRNNPEFLPLLNRDRTHWPRCLLWHGWLPGLTSLSSGSPWDVAAGDLASHNLEKALGPYPLSTLSAWHPFFGIRMMPKIWLMMSLSLLTFGQMVVGNLSLILMLRLRGLFILQLSSLIVVIGAVLRILMIRRRVALKFSRGSLAPYSRLVQRAEYWGVILALQAYSGIHIGIDNLNVFRGVAALLSQGVTRTPLTPL